MTRFIIAMVMLVLVLILSCKNESPVSHETTRIIDDSKEAPLRVPLSYVRQWVDDFGVDASLSKSLHHIQITVIPHTGEWFIENNYTDGSYDLLRRVDCTGLAKALNKRLGCSIIITPGVAP